MRAQAQVAAVAQPQGLADFRDIGLFGDLLRQPNVGEEVAENGGNFLALLVTPNQLVPRIPAGLYAEVDLDRPLVLSAQTGVALGMKPKLHVELVGGELGQLIGLERGSRLIRPDELNLMPGGEAGGDVERQHALFADLKGLVGLEFDADIGHSVDAAMKFQVVGQKLVPEIRVRFQLQGSVAAEEGAVESVLGNFDGESQHGSALNTG